MSRDALGPDATSPAAAAPASVAGPDVADDVDATSPPAPPDPSGLAGPSGPTGLSGWRRRRRGAVALVLAAAVGAGGALLAVRAHEASEVRLLVLSAAPDVDTRADAEDVSVRLLVANLGSEEVTVLGGGHGAPGGRVEGRVAPAGAAWMPAQRAEAPVVLPPDGTAALVLGVDATCDDLPPWRPWLEVRGGAAAEQVVQLETVDEVGGSEVGDPLQDACAVREQTALSPVSVVGHGTEDDAGAVSLALSNTTGAPYRLRVDGGGISGLSLAEGAVVLPAGSTTQVVLRVDPPRCAGALRADDLVSDAGVQVERTGGGEDDGPVAAPLDLWVAQTQVALAVGRVCADA